MLSILLALIGIVGTLTIVAYLRQVEDKMPELLRQMDTPDCPVCHLPHTRQQHYRKVKIGLRKAKGYCRRKRRAVFGYSRRA